MHNKGKVLNKLRKKWQKGVNAMYFQVRIFHTLHTYTTFEIDENVSIDKVKKSLVKTVKLHKLVDISEAIK